MFYQLLPELNYQIVEATKNEPTAAEKNAAEASRVGLRFLLGQHVQCLLEIGEATLHDPARARGCLRMSQQSRPHLSQLKSSENIVQDNFSNE